MTGNWLLTCRPSSRQLLSKLRLTDYGLKLPTCALRRSNGRCVPKRVVLQQGTDEQSTEDRLQTDFQTVQTERTKLQQLIDGLNNVNAENEKTRTEERIRLEKRAEALEKDK